MGQLTYAERILLVACVIAATLAISIGYLLPSSGTNILKDFIVFCAGAGIAYAVAMAAARSTATDRVRALCNRSVQRLGLAASHARDAAESLREHTAYSSDLSLEIIATALENLAEEAEVSMGDLEEMAGTKIRLDTLVAEALERIEAAAQRVLPGEEPEVKSKLLSAITEPLKKLEEQVKVATVSPRGLVPTSHSCPQCGKPMETMLGEFPGSTGHAECGSCGSQMTVHRLGDGSVFAKLTVPKLIISCPNCKTVIPLTLRPDEPEVVVRNCFVCGERMYVNVRKGVVEHSEKRPPLKAAYTIQGNRALITCPNCQNQIRAKLHPPDTTVKVSCARCTELIHADPA